MDMFREQRLAGLEEAFAKAPIIPIGSTEELARVEQVRAAGHFGFAQPKFRTAVRLHFSGQGVEGHDLSGSLAGSIIAGFAETVNATGALLHMPPGSTELFLSPVVTSGSTVLEMFGAPTENSGSEIRDTPVDAALNRLFEILGSINDTKAAPTASIAPIEGVLGKRLYSLVGNLLENDIDLDVDWTRPRGSTTSTSLSRAMARVLRDVLDVESIEITGRTEIGTLESVSTTGVIGFIIKGKKSTIRIAASQWDIELLRAAWAKQVELTWAETVTSHPRREEKKIKRELTSIREIAEPA